MRQSGHNRHTGCGSNQPARLDPGAVEALEPRSLLAADLPVPAFLAPQGNSANLAEVADMDGDGRDDLLIVTDRTIVFRKNTGAESFQPGSVTALPINPATLQRLTPLQVLSGDFDGDGDNDALVIATMTGIRGQYHERVWWFTNDGEGGLTLDGMKKDSIRPFYQPGIVRILDIDGDGSDELIVRTGRVINVAGGVIREKGAIGVNIADQQFTDFDGDGDMDMLSASQTTGGEGAIKLWRNAGLNSAGRVTGAFEDLVSLPDAPAGGPRFASAFRWVDVSGDGINDLVIGAWTGNVSSATNPPVGTVGVYAFVGAGGIVFGSMQTLFEESYVETRMRGGRDAYLPDEIYYSYGAEVSRIEIQPPGAPGQAASIVFRLDSTQSWTYRPTNADTFSDSFRIQLAPSGAAGPSGLPMYAQQQLSTPYEPFRPPTLAQGDLNGDGETDYVHARMATGDFSAGRVLYVEYSGRPEALPLFTETFHNGAQFFSSTRVFRTGDRLRVRASVSDAVGPGGPIMPATARLLIDSNRNGRLDASDAVIATASGFRYRDFPSAPLSTDRTRFNFGVDRDAFWGPPGDTFLFVVIDRPDGGAGIPITRPITLA